MVWQQLIQRLTRTDRNKTKRSAAPRRKTRRSLTLQTLHKRELMATDLAAISGLAFVDANGDGTQQVGESPLAGVRVELFRDFNDNGTIDAGDNLIGTAIDTLADGRYRFTNLDGNDVDGDPTTDPLKTNSGRYLVRFTDAPGGADLSGINLPPVQSVTITADTGVTQQVIDAFSTAQQVGGINITPGPGETFASSTGDVGPTSGILGNERDIQFDIDDNPSASTLSFSVNTTTNQLIFDTGSNMTARLTVQYDGVDVDGGGAGTTLAFNPIGLRGGGPDGASLDRSAVDDPATTGIDESVTPDSAAGLLIDVQSDQSANNVIEVRLYTDATNFASRLISLPGGSVATELFLPFSTFTNTSGTTNFSNIGAIVIQQLGFDGRVSLDTTLSVLESQRSNEFTVNAAAIQPLILGGEIFIDNGAGTNQVQRNNGIRDGGEPDFPASADPIEVQLFALTSLTDTVAPGATPIATTTVTGGFTSGAYSFTTLTNGDPLGPGTYAVVIPASQFATGQPLFGFQASIRSAGYANADDNVNNNNDGAFVAGVGVVAGAITLAVGGEPDTNADGTGVNDNRTVDFGVVPTNDLRITKSLVAAASTLTPGGTAVFDLVVENLGPLGATGISVQDFIPDGLTFTSVTLAGVNVPTTTATETPPGDRQIRTFTVDPLAAGASRTYRVTTSIQTDVTDDPTNEARVSGFEVDTDLTNNTSLAPVDIPLTTITVTKSDGLTTVNAGSTVVYTITVANTTADPALNLVALDTLPTGVTLESAVFTTGTGTIDTTNGGLNNGIIRVLFGDLTGVGTAGATETITVTVTVPPDFVADPSQINNSVTVTSDNAPTVNAADLTTVARLTDVQTTKTIVQSRVPDLRDNNPAGDIITSVAPFQFVAGGFATYRVQAINVGPSQARGVTIVDTLPTGLTLVPGSFSAGTSGVTLVQAGQTLTFTVPNLNPDNPTVTTDDVFFTYEVAIASSATTALVNPVAISTTDPESNTTNNTASASLTPSPRLDLILDKAVVPTTAIPGTVAAGGTAVTYTFTVSHDTDSLSDAINVDVTDVLPAGLTNVQIVAATATGTPSFNQTTRALLVEYASIPVGETRTFTVTANVAADATGTLTNTATVVSRGVADTGAVTELDQVNNTDSASVTLTPQFDLTVDKSVVGNTTVVPGATVTFNLLVAHDTNNDGTEADQGRSPSRATGVVVTDTLPAGMTFVSATSGGVAVTPTSTTGGVIVFPAFTLDPTATRVLTVVATVNATAAGTLTNNTSFVTAAGETDTTNNSDVVDIIVTPQANLTVSKAVSQTVATVGSQLTYTVTVNNVGVSAAAAATAIDTLPSGVTFVSGTGPNGALTATNGVVTVNGGTLAAGGSFQFTILATINAGVTAAQTNSVTVSTTTTETSTADNTATATTTIDLANNTISGRVFNDANRNGLQDTGELGQAGVSMQLTGGALTTPLTTLTDANGDYTFANLAAGTYTVQRLSLPAETADGLEQAGTGATPSQLGDNIAAVTVGNGTVARPQNNFAIVPTISKRRFLRSFYDPA